MASKSTNLGVTISGVKLYATSTGLKFGAKDRVQSPGSVYGSLDKGTARRIRKACRRAGLIRHAAAPAASV